MPGVDVTNNILANFARFINGIDPEDPDYLREVMRPAEIREDVRLMEQHRRVSLILQSAAFRRQLDSIISSQLSVCENPTACHPGLRFSMGSVSVGPHFPSGTTPTVQTNGQAKGASSLIPINDLRSIPTIYSEVEQQYRCKLASLYRLIDLLGWSSSIYNHISVRIRREGEEVLVNPFGLLYHEVTAGGLLKVDLKGNVLDPGCTQLGLDTTGWKLHSTVLSANPKIRCVIHLTTPAVIAISRSAERLLPLSREAIVVGQAVFVDSVGQAEDAEEYTGIEHGQQQRLKALLAPTSTSPGGAAHTVPRVIFLRGSGLLAIGTTVEEAWFYASNAVQACEAQLSLSSVSLDDLWLPSVEECEELRHDLVPALGDAPNSPRTPRSAASPPGSESAAVEWRVGEMELEALMRHLDNAGYRTGYCYRSTGIPYGIQLDSTDGAYKGSPRRTPGGSAKTRKDRADVEIPPIPSYSDGERSGTGFGARKSSTPYWMTSPNHYSKYEMDDGDVTDGGADSTDDQLLVSSGDEGPPPSSVASEGRRKPKTHWVAKSDVPQPLKSSTLPPQSAAESAPNKYAPQGGNPKEYKENQRKVRDKYYQDVNTAGPRSRLLEGLTLEELMQLKREGLAKQSEDGNRLILLAATSKGIIDKEHRNDTPWLETAVVAANPFQKITDEELQQYRQEMKIKNDPELAHLVKEQEERLEQEKRLQEQKEREAKEEKKPTISIEVPVPAKTVSSSPAAEASQSPSAAVARSDSTKQGVTPPQTPAAPGSRPSLSATLPTSSRLAALKSDTSGAEASYDDTEKEGTDTGDSKEKKKKRRIKMFSFSRKKKEGEKPK